MALKNHGSPPDPSYTTLDNISNTADFFFPFLFKFVVFKKAFEKCLDTLPFIEYLKSLTTNYNDGKKYQEKTLTLQEAGNEIWNIIQEEVDTDKDFDQAPLDVEFLNDFEGGNNVEEIEIMYLWAFKRVIPTVLKHPYFKGLENSFKEYDLLWNSENPFDQSVLSIQILANLFNDGAEDERFTDTLSLSWIQKKLFSMMEIAFKYVKQVEIINAD